MNLSKIKDYEQYSDRNLEFASRMEMFISSAGIGSSRIEELASDASSRSYYRIFDKKGSSVIMDAKDQDDCIKQFINVRNILAKNDIAVPQIYHHNKDLDMLLLEDFGNDTYDTLLKKEPSMEEFLYKNATLSLIKIQEIPQEDSLEVESTKDLKDKLLVFSEWFLKNMINKRYIKIATKELLDIFESCASIIDEKEKKVITLKDYHSPNLMYLKHHHTGTKSVGVIDFQDAVMSHRAYDLVSLLQDARYNISQATQDTCMKEYIDSSNDIGNKDDLIGAYHVIGAQRNMRILGCFFRLRILHSKEKYMKYIPIVKKNLSKCINHPSCLELKKWFQRYEVQID